MTGFGMMDSHKIIICGSYIPGPIPIDYVEEGYVREGATTLERS